MTRHRFAFVLEQTLGHVAHGRNLERALAAEAGIEASITRIEYVPPGRLPGIGNWSLRASRRARAALRAQLRPEPPDAAFIHTQVASLLSVDLMASIPTVVSLDATPYNFDQLGHAYQHRRASDAAEAFKRWANRRSFMAARALVTWCQWAADSLVADYAVPAEKIRVIHPGVDLSLFQPGPARPTDGRVRVLFVGGDFWRKGGGDLLEAVTGLEDVIELDLVTGSRDLPAQPGLVCRIHHGVTPQSPELIQLYRSADIFVLPSRGDCFPQVLGEALACGLPLVATGVGAMPEVAKDGANGYVVPPASPRELGTALRALVEHPERRREFGRRGLALARERHDARRNAAEIFSIMRSISRTPIRTG